MGLHPRLLSAAAIAANLHVQIRDASFLVTGGASGLGAACVRDLIQHGGRVVIADLNVSAGQQLADELGETACFTSTDVTSPEQVQAAVDLAVAKFGKLNGVVNCAGILSAGRVLGKDGPHELEKFARTIHVNLVGTFNVIRLAAAAIAKSTPNADGERGAIINTSSIAASEGQIGQAAYSASKAGVAGMTLPLARELARFGIRVVAIAPGVFDTSMMGAMSEEAVAALSGQVPFPPRMGKPQEFAQLACQIFENPMLNGTVIRLDGGLRMSAK